MCQFAMAVPLPGESYTNWMWEKELTKVAASDIHAVVRVLYSGQWFTIKPIKLSSLLK